VKFTGKYFVEHFRNGKMIGRYIIQNDVTDEGLQGIVEVMFRADITSQPTAFYIGLIDNTGYLNLSNSDTASLHTGWAEFNKYDESSRPAWQPTLDTTPAVYINSASSVYTINDIGNLRGCFLQSDSVKSGVNGILWSTALFAAVIPVASADVFRCQYQLTAERG